MKKAALFIGCTVPVRGTNYEQSFREVAKVLQIELVDHPGFSCCGFPTHAINRMTALALSARNLALANQASLSSMITLCNACTENMTHTNHLIQHDPVTRDEINRILNQIHLQYHGEVKVKHAMRYLYEEIGLDTIRASVQKPLSNLRIAAYPGCHYTKPSELYEGFDNPENPHTLNELVMATGASIVSYESSCCGGGTLGAKEDTALQMGIQTLKSMKENEADAIVLICPFCDVMFEQNQKKMEKLNGEEFNLPILYYPQLLGLAMNIEREKLGLTVNRIKLDKVLEKIQSGNKE
ncbi:CoB--CoM heterodisulfide reductase iron-sulfur subunit B family protein [bacterium]|nr:CoB--CoM heterodisulfide reductase iron-sulfur subunit B family protein [bacterium]